MIISTVKTIKYWMIKMGDIYLHIFLNTAWAMNLRGNIRLVKY